MNTLGTYKLPVLKIVIGSLVLPWYQRARFSSALATPTLLLVSFWALNVAFKDESNVLLSWLVLPLYLVVFSIFAVTCHRLILLPQENPTFRITFAKREFKFLAWVVLIFLTFYLSIMSALMIFSYIPLRIKGDIDFTKNVLFVMESIARVFAIYIFARLCLVFPAAAIDEDRGFYWSWVNTRHNGWRMAVIVGLYPWLISLVIWLLSRTEATLLEKLITGLLYYLGMAVEVFALSLTYREISTSMEGSMDSCPTVQKL